MTDEQKRKMADGRRKAALDRAAAAKTAEAIERELPAGDERNDTLRAHRDLAEESAGRLEEQTGAIALDPSKLDVKKVDNEIASKWNPEKGDIPFAHPQPGFLYSWVTRELSHGEAARTSIRAMHAGMRRVGWHPVDSSMPEAKDHELDPQGHRYCGDTELWRIRREEWAKVEESNRRKRTREEGIEREFAEMVERTGVGHALGPETLARAYGQERMRPITYSAQFSQEQIRSGNGPLKPGFEYRR